MWDWRYCCGHLWKIQPAILSYVIRPTSLQGKLSTLIGYLPLNQITAKESQAGNPVLRHWTVFISTLNSFGFSVWICWFGWLWLFSSCGHSQEVVLKKVGGGSTREYHKYCGQVQPLTHNCKNSLGNKLLCDVMRCEPTLSWTADWLWFNHLTSRQPSQVVVHKDEMNQTDSLSQECELRNRRRHLFMGMEGESS